MSKYAEGTSVPADRSRAEIERILQRYGATGFIYGWDRDRAIVAFRMNDRMLRMVLPMPDRTDREFQLTPTGKRRTENTRQEAYEQAVRQRWRAQQKQHQRRAKRNGNRCLAHVGETT